MMKIILERKSYLTSGCHSNLRYLSLGFVPAAMKRSKGNLLLLEMRTPREDHT